MPRFALSTAISRFALRLAAATACCVPCAGAAAGSAAVTASPTADHLPTTDAALPGPGRNLDSTATEIGSLLWPAQLSSSNPAAPAATHRLLSPPFAPTNPGFGLHTVGRGPVEAGAIWRTGRNRWQLPVPAGTLLIRDLDLPSQPWLPGHRGIDVQRRPGSVLLAPAAGQVSVARVVAGRPVVTLLHADGHRSSFDPAVALVPPGTTVAANTPIAVVGDSTGHCPHSDCVHWGVRWGDTYVDPLDRGPVHVRLLPAP